MFWSQLFLFLLHAKYTYLLPRLLSIWIGVHDLGTYLLLHEAWLEACEPRKEVVCLQHMRHTSGSQGQDAQNRLSRSEHSVKNNSCSDNLVNFMGQRTSSLLGKVIKRMWSPVDPGGASRQSTTPQSLSCPWNVTSAHLSHWSHFQGHRLETVR